MSLKLRTNSGPLKGTIAVPGDKSISHRAVMFGSIAEGTTEITNFLPGEDCLSTIACFRKLGVEILRDGSKVIVKGKGLEGLKEPEDVLDVGNSGTTIRLMMGILAGRPFHSILTGDPSIGKRPMTRVTNPLMQMGAEIKGRGGAEYTPISISGGKLEGIEYRLPVASAQVKSAILLAGLQAKGRTTVIEPEKTRDHTERMISLFGGKAELSEGRVTVKGGQRLHAASVNVPGDISSAAFFLAAGAAVPGSIINLENVGLNETRTGILDVLLDMGAEVSIQPDSSFPEPAGRITISHSTLRGTTIGGSLIPRLIDEIPIIALLATQAEGETVIKDAAELKVKETNRIDTVVNELSKMGADISATPDGMVIKGKTPLHGAKVSSHGDHRIGMMLSIAALIADGETELEDAQATAVSYPDFFAHLDSLI